MSEPGRTKGWAQTAPGQVDRVPFFEQLFAADVEIDIACAKAAGRPPGVGTERT